MKTNQSCRDQVADLILSTFGNFPVSYKGLCNEWRNSAGEQLTDGSEKPDSGTCAHPLG